MIRLDGGGGCRVDRIDQSLIALRRILLATEIYERNLARSIGLTGAQLRVLQIVHETGISNPTAISTRMGVTQATVTGMTQKLEAAGMLCRERSAADRRQMNLTITQEGRDAVDNAPDPLQQSYVRKFAQLEDWEQAMVLASLERVAVMLNADDIDASPVLSTAMIGQDAVEKK